MKLFRKAKDKNEDRILLVKIINERLSLDSSDLAQSALPVEPEPPKKNHEFNLKLAAVFVALVNGILAIWGYVDFTGRLDAFGISPTEIDLGLPALLFQGWRSGVLNAYQYATDSFGGMLAVLVIPAFLFFPFVSRALKERRWEDRVVLCLILALLLMIVSIAPNVGLRSGQQAAYSAFRQQNPVDGNFDIRGLEVEKTYVTKEGPTITGDTIFASSLYSYVLEGPKLYKIQNRDNHVVSVTKINPVLRSKHKPTVKTP
jgi:hypothetical protein